MAATGVVSARNPIHAEILARPAPRVTGVWLIARTPVDRPYPCRCRLGKRCRNGDDKSRWCHCYGRTDVDRLPPHCCGRHALFTPGLLNGHV
jgi:hypothetical protein